MTYRVSDDHDTLTPVGSPTAVPIPVAPVVTCLIGVKVLFIHKFGVEDAVEAVLILDSIVPIAVTLPQPPVSCME